MDVVLPSERLSRLRRVAVPRVTCARHAGTGERGEEVESQGPRAGSSRPRGRGRGWGREPSPSPPAAPRSTHRSHRSEEQRSPRCSRRLGPCSAESAQLGAASTRPPARLPATGAGAGSGTCRAGRGVSGERSGKFPRRPRAQPGEGRGRGRLEAVPAPPAGAGAAAGVVERPRGCGGGGRHEAEEQESEPPGVGRAPTQRSWPGVGRREGKEKKSRFFLKARCSKPGCRFCISSRLAPRAGQADARGKDGDVDYGQARLGEAEGARGSAKWGITFEEPG